MAEKIAGVSSTPTRDKVENALGAVPKPKIKLNVDATEQKNKIKLNIKPKA